MGKPSLFIAVVISLCAWSQPTIVYAESPDELAAQNEIRSWIDGLQSDQFAVREWATESLIAAGGTAIEPLATSIANVDIESMERGLSILHSLALAESKTAQQAEDALRRLAANRATTSAQRADEVLRSIASSRTLRAENILRRLGAEFDAAIVTAATYTYSSSVKTVSFGDKWKGSVKDLAYVSWLTRYQKIAIKVQGEKFTDDHLIQIANAPNLVGLTISRASITDDGMSVMQDMPLLQDLRIYYCDISDNCLQFIGGDASDLRTFSIFGSKITRSAFDQLMSKHESINGRYGLGGFLGIAGQKNPKGKGCIVTGVTPNEAASKSGILVDDVIMEYNGQAVTEFIPSEQLMNGFAPVIPPPDNAEETEARTALSELIGGNAPGERVKIKILRRGQYIMKEVELGEWP